MPIGLLGKKLGMTQVYDDYGRHVAVTAVRLGPCTVLEIREPVQDGSRNVQMGFETVKESKVSKPRMGQFKKAGTGPFRYVHEFRVPAAQAAQATPPSKAPATDEAKDAKSDDAKGDAPKADEAARRGPWRAGQQLTMELFSRYERVDVTGTSIGKGFQGGMKRWGWSGGPESHGSMSHRTPGSIGASAFPARVLRGRHLPGHMGAARVTVENLRIVRLDLETNIVLIEGAIPGPEQSLVIVEKATKRFERIDAPQGVTVVEDEEGSDKKRKGTRKS